MTRRRRWGCRLSVAAVAVAVAAGVGASPAAAHPFGDPPRARISAAGDTLSMVWSAADDDYVMLGTALEVISDREVFVYESDGVAVAPSLPGEDKLDVLASAPSLGAYVRDHVAVTQDGHTCALTVDTADLAEQGVRLSAGCAERIEEVTLNVSLLTDLHPAYRTVTELNGAAESNSTVFTQAEPEQVIRFVAAQPTAGAAPSGTTDGGPPRWPVSAGAVFLVVVGVVLVFARRGGRSGR